MEFSKKLLVVDYLILIGLLACSVLFTEVDFTTILVAWMAQTAISSGAYYWKAKNENRIKVPLKVVENLPAEIQDKVDLTQVIVAIIQSE